MVVADYTGWEFLIEDPVVYAAAVAMILPFAVIAVGFILNYTGIAIASLFSLFADPEMVYAAINYLFFPGVMLHELSHALLAFLTGAKITEIALFKREGDALGHVSFINRGNFFVQSLQNTFASAAPMFCGAVVVYACYYGITQTELLWLKILLGYIGVSMFYHMTMSPADIRIYLRGLPVFIAIVFIVTFVLRVTSVI